jgi:hypothetical protein
MPEDDWRKRDRNFQEPLLSRNLRFVKTLRSVGRRHKASPSEDRLRSIVGRGNRFRTRATVAAPIVRLHGCINFYA